MKAKINAKRGSDKVVAESHQVVIGTTGTGMSFLDCARLSDILREGRKTNATAAAGSDEPPYYRQLERRKRPR